jgi:hypothetical protein
MYLLKSAVSLLLFICLDYNHDINESIQMNENRKKVIDIHNSMVSLPPDLNLVEPHRIFVLQGVLTKVCRKAPKKFTFFLFSDVLLYAEPYLGDRYYLSFILYHV